MIVVKPAEDHDDREKESLNKLPEKVIKSKSKDGDRLLIATTIT